MHPSPAFHWTDEAAMLAAAGAMGWARLFAATPAGPRVAHSAVLVDPVRPTLRFHVANANLIRPGLATGNVLALFEGPHAYVSASWYREPAMNVPTWNYVAIECEGPVVALGRDALVELLDDLAAAHEGTAGETWSRSMMERPRFDAMLGAITAYELSVEAIRGTRKLSQNKSAVDVAVLAEGVERSGAAALADLMRAGGMTVRLAIFDCDGTLVDSGATIHSALTLALKAHGRPVPPAREARRVIGLSLFEAMDMLVPGAEPAEIEAMAETYRLSFQGLRGAGQVEEPLFEGIAPLIDALASDGWALGVATGKSDRGLAHCLASHGLADRFVTLQTADRHPSKPHPAMALAAMAEAGAMPQDTVMIGDTGWDMGCARAAGIGAIGVAWGYHEAEELLREGAHVVAEDPADVLALAQAWVERAA